MNLPSKLTALAIALTALLLAGGPVRAQAPAPAYQPADTGQRPVASGPRILPDQFLRGFDPITAYFDSDVGPGRGDADDGRARLSIAPTWPGAWFWVDRRTLQFRPAEAWPPLARYQVEAKGARRILTTMMSAPSALSPASGSTDLRPFRAFTLTFPQALPIDGLKKMLRLELRDAPGLTDSASAQVSRFTLAQLPRGSTREAAVYAVTLDQEIPEGKLLLVNVGLALGEGGEVLWTGRLATRPRFHLVKVRCGDAELAAVAGATAPRDGALACGGEGARPQLVFSAPPKDLTLGQLKRLVRLDPAVPDLDLESSGDRVTLRGKFVPDLLYRMRLDDAPIHDDSDRTLRDPGGLELYFYVGAKSPFLRWSQSSAILEADGPRMLPLVGYGDTRADVRVYRVDPLHDGLWPFPSSPVVVQEETAPPFPGEEPAPPELQRRHAAREIGTHIRLLGTPLVSRVVPLPLEKRSSATRFGLDLAPLLDPVVGKNRPGTYLVGLRRLTGRPERAYVRVQVTNLSLSVAEEHARAVLFVRTLDRAEPVKGAQIRVEGLRSEEVVKDGHPTQAQRPARVELVTDGDGQAVLGRLDRWSAITRVSVIRGDDALVIDPSEAPPRFAGNHWSLNGRWLEWLTQPASPPSNEKTFAFLFTERPIYRPGEPVLVKGWVRHKRGGALAIPASPAGDFGLRVEAPDGRAFPLPFTLTPLGGFSARLEQAELPTGAFKVVFFDRKSNATLGERQFRIEAYRIPTFEVQLSHPLTVPLDRPFQVKALARYYAGGAASGQPITWSVTQRPYHHVPAGREGFLFASSAQFARPSAARPPPAARREAQLDASGADVMRVDPGLDLDGSPRTYVFEATVTGPDEQLVSATQEVKGLPPFLLGMKLQRYLEKAVEVKPEVLAIGPDDQPVAGQEVTVRVFRRVWHNQLRETPFATGKAKYVTEQEDVKVAEHQLKTGPAPVAVPIPIHQAGVYVVELTGRDRLGRVQTLSADLYAGGPGPVAWQKTREGVFQLTPDKKSYQPGQTARVVIESPVQSGRALVAVEEPAGNTYRWVDVSGGKGVVEVPIQEAHVPNLPVHVLLLRGRVGEGGTDDSRYRPQTVGASLDLEVEPVRNRVAVKVDHPESARPGSQVDLVVTLADERKRPLAGEVTLWLVDEAVLSLAKEKPLDPLDRFIERNSALTSLRDTRNAVVGKLLEQEEEPGGDGGDEDQSGPRAKRAVRKNFQTVPFYQATLQVPASGRLVVPVKLSDDLTNFKVRAVAASGPSRFGLHQSVLRVRIPVLIQPQLPRLVRAGDRFWPGGVARMLEGKDGPGAVDVEVVGAGAGAAGHAKVVLPIQLAASKPASGLTPITVGQVNGPSELTVRVGVTRKGDGAGDAFEVKLPVLPDRNPERFAYLERLSAGKVALRPFPEAPRAGTVTQEVVLSSVPGVLEFASGLDYLLGYPHGCLEQRASQLYPQIALAGFLRDAGLSGPEREVKANLHRFLTELPLHQSENGLLGYWPGTPGDVALTAQVLELLQAARAAGISPDEKVEARAVAALQAILRSDAAGLLPHYRLNQQTAAIRALARTGHLDEHYLVELFQARSNMDVTSLADLTSSMALRPALFRTNLDALRSELWDSVIVKLRQGQPVFEKLNWRRSGWGEGYLGSDASSVAAVWRALVEVDPTNPKQDLLRDALISYLSPEGGFGDTHATRRALEALAAYVDKATPPVAKSSLALAGQAELQVDGKRKAAHLTTHSEQPLSGALQGGAAGIRVNYTYLPAAPGDQVAASPKGFIVSRSMSMVSEDGAMDPPEEDQAGQVRQLAVGQVVELHARIVTEQERWRVALVVPFAAGLELLDPALQTSGAVAHPSERDALAPTYVQRLDGEVRYYFDVLPRGSHSFHFRLRAASEGSFVHPAPWAEMMYHQEVRGRGDGLRVIVTGGHQKP